MENFEEMILMRQNNGCDYDIYEMNMKEKIIGYCVCAVAAGVAMQIFFRFWIFSLISGAALGIIGIRIYRGMLNKKRKENLVIQFRDMLGAVATSIGSGRNIPDSFQDAYVEMKQQYGENACIVEELSSILSGLRNNINIEALLTDFANRSHQEDIQSFADIFKVANRRGGSISQIILETKELISDKISVELEIRTMISGKSNELNIMIILPLIVVSQLNGMMNTQGGNIFLMIGVKTVAIMMFVGAYCLGKKIMDISV